ncbi:unnamed protein product [Gongylonema pulchrum]|uniref:Conserved oligomeric Golgi complex subunit 3 n=1 Tax=Gongylonema pulchrum TaxID=637853 RepID=A0A183EDB7_9BILA|nr:unnamed protein product [Gongylonema pulchrum]
MWELLSFKVSGQCAEQIQRCAVITEEYERLIQEVKHSAFRHCFTKQTRSVLAVRSLLDRGTPESDNFGDTAHRYMVALENCFAASDEQAASAHFPDLSVASIDGRQKVLAAK